MQNLSALSNSAYYRTIIMPVPIPNTAGVPRARNDISNSYPHPMVGVLTFGGFAENRY